MASGIQEIDNIEMGEVSFSVGLAWATGMERDKMCLYAFYGFREDTPPEFPESFKQKFRTLEGCVASFIKAKKEYTENKMYSGEQFDWTRTPWHIAWAVTGEDNMAKKLLRHMKIPEGGWENPYPHVTK